MKINVTATLAAFDGTPVVNEQREPWTLGAVIIGALLRDTPAEARGDTFQTPEQKFKQGLLAKRVHDAEDEVEVTLEEAALIKQRVGLSYPTLLVTSAWLLLEQGEG